MPSPQRSTPRCHTSAGKHRLTGPCRPWRCGDKFGQNCTTTLSFSLHLVFLFFSFSRLSRPARSFRRRGRVGPSSTGESAGDIARGVKARRRNEARSRCRRFRNRRCWPRPHRQTGYSNRPPRRRCGLRSSEGTRRLAGLLGKGVDVRSLMCARFASVLDAQVAASFSSAHFLDSQHRRAGRDWASRGC